MILAYHNKKVALREKASAPLSDTAIRKEKKRKESSSSSSSTPPKPPKKQKKNLVATFGAVPPGTAFFKPASAPVLLVKQPAKALSTPKVYGAPASKVASVFLLLCLFFLAFCHIFLCLVIYSYVLAYILTFCRIFLRFVCYSCVFVCVNIRFVCYSYVLLFYVCTYIRVSARLMGIMVTSK